MNCTDKTYFDSIFRRLGQKREQYLFSSMMLTEYVAMTEGPYVSGKLLGQHFISRKNRVTSLTHDDGFIGRKISTMQNN